MKKILKSIVHFFKKDKIDWLDEQPYLGKYFLYKIKRLIMNVIYKIWESLDELTLEKYLCEIEFKNEEKTFEAVLKFIILCKNHDEATIVREAVVTSLVNTYKFNIGNSIIHKQIATKDMLEIEKEKIITEIKSHKSFGTITFNSYIGSKTIPNLASSIPFNMGDEVVNSTMKLLHKKDIQFQIIKNTSKYLYQNDEYLVRVEFLEKKDAYRPQGNVEDANDLSNRMDNLNK